MDKCSCLNAESTAGVLKTVYLFLEAQNFRQTCDTFLSESQVMGYAEFKKAMARILVLKPSFTEVVKVSHADPGKSEHQIQPDLPIFMDAAARNSSTKNVCVYYGEPLCTERPECSTSAPELVRSPCPCQSKQECRKGGVNIVETIDNTRNDMETERILKKAIQDEVRVAPPPLPEPTETADSKKDKKINFKQSAQVYIQPKSVVPIIHQSKVYESHSTTFPIESSLATMPTGEQQLHNVGPVAVEQEVFPKSISKLEKSHQITDKNSVSSQSPRSTVADDVRTSRTVSIQSQLQGSTLSGRKSTISRQKGSIPERNLDAVEEIESLPPGSIVQTTHTTDHGIASSASNVQPSAATLCPGSCTSLEGDKATAYTSDFNLAESSDFDDCPFADTVCPSRTSVHPAASRKSNISQRMSAMSVKPSERSIAPTGSVPPRSLEKGTVNIASCLSEPSPPPPPPVESQTMATSTSKIKSVESSTDGVRTICKSIYCAPNSVERSVSTRSLKSKLDYIKLKKELRSGCPSVRIVLLQALRWRITRGTDDGDTTDIVSDYTRHDLLSLHGSPSGNHRSVVEEFLCATSEKNATKQEEGMARMLNVMASLALGRDYLCQDESLLTRLIIPLVMDVYPYKDKITDVTKEHLLVALQKLSLRNHMRIVMIQSGLPDYLVFYLSARHNQMSDYCLEYCLALFMNLCLHTETHARLKKKSKEVVRFITDFLSAGHDSCLSYLNSAMYNLFMDPDIRKEAKHEHLDKTISDKSKSVDEETKQQMEVVLDLLNMNKQSTPCSECGCTDQDDEVDHLESELESGDPVKGDPNGEALLRLYQLRTISPGSNAVPLTCTCRPITPLMKISASERCPTPDAPPPTAPSSAEPDKKSKKHKFCFSICSKKKEDKNKVAEQSALEDDENVLASEECPIREDICCPSDDEDIPTKETNLRSQTNLQSQTNFRSQANLQSQSNVRSHVSIRESVLEYDPSVDYEASTITPYHAGSGIGHRSISRQGIMRDSSRTTMPDEERIVTVNPSEQYLVEKDSSILSAYSRQRASVPTFASRQSMGSMLFGSTLVCSEKEDDPCLEVCTGRQQNIMSKQSQTAVNKRSSLSRCPSRQRTTSAMQQHDMIAEEPSLCPSRQSICPSRQSICPSRQSICPSRQSVLQEERSSASCQACVSKSVSCSSIDQKTMAGTTSAKPSHSVLSSKKDLSLMPLTSESILSRNSGTDLAPTEDNVRKGPGLCDKCCGGKPKKQNSTLGSNFDSEDVDDQEAVKEKSVATSSKGVLAKEQRGCLPPSYTRSVINNQPRQRPPKQDAYYYCSNTQQQPKQQQQPCPPCPPCANRCYAYTTCYREPLQQCNYYNKTMSSASACPQVQQRNRYTCECYNNVKQFVQNADLGDSKTATPQQPQRRSSCRSPKMIQENNEIIDIPTPEEEFNELESAVGELHIFCEPGGNELPNIDCECYKSVFQSRPKLTRTP